MDQFFGRPNDAARAWTEASTLTRSGPGPGGRSSPDPVAGATGPVSLNPYGYANLAPSAASDPTGLATDAHELVLDAKPRIQGPCTCEAGQAVGQVQPDGTFYRTPAKIDSAPVPHPQPGITAPLPGTKAKSEYSGKTMSDRAGDAFVDAFVGLGQTVYEKAPGPPLSPKEVRIFQTASGALSGVLQMATDADRTDLTLQQRVARGGLSGGTSVAAGAGGVAIAGLLCGSGGCVILAGGALAIGGVAVANAAYGLAAEKIESFASIFGDEW